MNITELKQALPFYFKAGLVPLIWGRHGVGKSQAIKQVGEETGYNVIDIRLGQLADAGDLLGLAEFVKDKNGNSVATKFMRPNWLPSTPKHIIFLDEINRAPKDVMQAVFQLILDKKIHEYVLPDDCYIVAAANPTSGDYDTFDMVQTDKALQDRFVHLKLAPSADEFIEYQRKKEMNKTLLNFVSENKDKLLYTDIDFSFDFVTGSNRTIEAIGKLENLNMPENLLKESLHGMWGIEKTQLYFKFKENNLTRLKAEDVLFDYDKVSKVVTKLSSVDENRNDVLKVTCDEIVEVYKNMKSKKKAEASLENLVSFLSAIPKDLSFAFIKNIPTVNMSNLKDVHEQYNLAELLDDISDKSIETKLTDLYSQLSTTVTGVKADGK